MLSTVLLLIFLGILIFYLTNPNNIKDTFDNHVSATTASNSKDNANKLSIPPSMPANAPSPTLFSDPSRNPLNIQGDILSSPKTSNPYINYVGNIDNTDNLGADINQAFEPPSGIQNQENVIDFNKNNMDQYNVKDYLPKDIQENWFDTDFSQARHLNDDNLINPDRFVIGVNTVGQSLKNPSWDIRGTVPCPKYTISPWNNSTFEPDYNLKPLC